MRLWIYILFLTFTTISCTSNDTEVLQDVEKIDSGIEEIEHPRNEHILGQDIYGNSYIIDQSDYQKLISETKEKESDSLLVGSYNELDGFDSSEGSLKTVYRLIKNDNIEFLPFLNFMMDSFRQTFVRLL